MVLTLVGRWGTLGGLLGLLLRGLGGCRHRHHRHVAGAAAVAAAREAAAAQVVAARLVHQQARRLERHIVLRKSEYNNQCTDIPRSELKT